MEVLSALPGRLESWKTLSPSGIRAEVKSSSTTQEQGGHEIRQLFFSVVNDSARRVSEFNAELRIPAVILKHNPLHAVFGNKLTEDQKYRVSRIDEKNGGLSSLVAQAPSTQSTTANSAQSLRQVTR